jgi:hypothetical protein
MLQRKNRRTDAGNAVDKLADIQADIRRKSVGVAAGNPPEIRRTQKPSLDEGAGLSC